MKGGTMNSASNETAENFKSGLNSLSEKIRETRELLQGVSEATDETLQGDLNPSVMVLVQLLDLLESWQQADPPIADEALALTEFIDGALAALRSSGGDESIPFQQVEQLSRQAVDRWGDYLTLADDVGFDAIENDGWHGFAHDFAASDSDENDERDESDAAHAEMDSPTEQQISDLIAQLADSCVAPSPSPAELPSASTPVAAADDAVEIDDEIREAFLDDAGRCLSSMEEALLAFEAQPKNRSPLQQICRELHTLKGAAGSVGLVELADFLHEFEDSLRDSHAPECAVPSLEWLFDRLDTIRKQVERVAAGGDATDQASEPRDRGEDGSANETPAPAAIAQFVDAASDDESVRVKSSQLNRLMDMLAELVMLRNRRDSELSELKGIHSELIHSVSRLRSIGDGGRLDDLRGDSQPKDAVAEIGGQNHALPRLTEVASDILESAQRLRDCYQPVAAGNLAVSQFIRQFRQELVELRRMPVSGLFRRLQRVASDAARAERKQVHLRLVGEDGGIERSLQERLYEPLLHIIRNAVSHGIEEAEERARHGKDPVGVVTLEAQTGSDLLVLEIRDDGRGLNYDALRRRGIERGLLQPNKAATRDELAMLIFHPGFSTQQTASQISGRGVGMDVVASAIARMRGWVEVDSMPGHGTTVRLTFPLPSVIQHTMVFRASNQIFALPMQFVQGAGSSTEEVRAVPFGKLFGAADAWENAATPTQMLVLASQTSSTGMSDTRRFALLVDEIIGPEEVVVRPMPSLLRHHPLCSGATLSGMGEVVLVLDKRRVMELVLRHASPRPADDGPLAAKPDRSDSDLPKVLVVDDSLSARKRLVRALNRYQIEITEASDGVEASEILKTHSFAAVFSDLEMPRKSGLELLAEIRAGGCEKDLPVVIVSSRLEDELRTRAIELGANAYLTKPLASTALDEAIASFLPLSDRAEHLC